MDMPNPENHELPVSSYDLVELGQTVNTINWRCTYKGCNSTEREVCYKAYRCVKCYSYAGSVFVFKV